jgi:hypothetical protein
MTNSPVFFVNNPVSGVQYWSKLWCGCVAAASDSISIACEVWSGANGTGSLVAVSTLQLWVWDFTTGSSVSTSTLSGVNQGVRTTSLATAGHTIQASAKWTGGQTVGSLRMYISYGTSSAYVPGISSFTPSIGGPGTSVVITGTHLLDVDTCKFNGTSASFSIDSETQITATVPSGATTGPILLSQPAGGVNSSTNYTPISIWTDNGTNWVIIANIWTDNGAAWVLANHVYADDGAAWQQIA